MSTNESSIHLVDSLSGDEKKKLYCKSSGIGKLEYTHHESCVLLSSEKKSFDLKYQCFYDNRILRNFKGHTDKVTSLSISPIDDTFISASADKSVRLWNLNSAAACAKIQLPSYVENPTAKYDESGVVFGVMCFDTRKKMHNLKLFDSRNFEAGPFQNIVPEGPLFESAALKTNQVQSLIQAQKSLQSPWLSFEFSTDGNHILVNTQSELLLVLDGFRSEVEPLVIASRKNDNNISLGACFSANSKTVVTANEENELMVLDKTSGELLGSFGGHVAPVGCVRSNPKYDQIASGCVNTVLWIPKPENSSTIAD